MARRRHTSTGAASVLGAVARLVFLACALIVAALTLAGLLNAWLGTVIVLAATSVAIVLVASHLRKHSAPGASW